MPKLQVEGVLGTQHAIGSGSGINGVVFVMMYGLDHPCRLSNGFQLTLTCDESVWFERIESRPSTRIEEYMVRNRYDCWEKRYREVPCMRNVDVQYQDKRNVFTRTYNVCANADLASGENWFPFQIPLTNDMPPSFKMKSAKAKGSVLYTFKAEYLDPMTGNTISSETMQGVEIISSVLKSDFIQKLDAPRELGKASVDVAPSSCMGCVSDSSKGRKISVKISACPQHIFIPKGHTSDLPTKQVVVGDKYSVVAAPSPNRGITVGMRIDNQGKKPISCFELTLTQDVQCCVKNVKRNSSFALYKLKIILDEDKKIQPKSQRTILATLPFPHNMNAGGAGSSSPDSYLPTYSSKFMTIKTGMTIGFNEIQDVDSWISCSGAFQFVGAINESEYQTAQGVVLQNK